jgi:hypothetical protein
MEKPYRNDYTKTSVASSVVRTIKPFLIQDTMKIVYRSYSYSLINYGIIFWGNSSCSNSILKLQKRIIRIIVGIGIGDSCREFFKILSILPMISQYIFSCVLFVVNNNNNKFRMNFEIYSINTRINSNFHQHLSYLTIKKVPLTWLLGYITVLNLK